jgi:hypothetical protein
MVFIPLTGLNQPTLYFMSCHGSFILFTEVMYVGSMALELMFQIYVMSLSRAAILFKEVWHANCMVIRVLLQFHWCSTACLMF